MANPYGKYRLHLKNFRAIEEADITLDGITVVAGINACGKSTISRLFYETFRCSNAFREIAFAEIAKKCFEIERELYHFTALYEIIAKEQPSRQNLDEEFGFQYPAETVFSVKRFLENFDKAGEDDIFTLIRKAKDIAERFNKLSELQIWSRRLARSLTAGKIQLLQKENPYKNQEDLGVVLAKLECSLKNEFVAIEQRVLRRDFDIFKSELIQIFPDLFDDELPLLEKGIEFSFRDDDGEITDRKNKILALISGVKETFYYDAPQFYLNISPATQPYYQAIKKVLNDEERKPENSARLKVLNDEFLFFTHGRAWIADNWTAEKFWFGREDGRRFPMRECATGLKSVGLLQMLMNKGALTETTAVFLDEPEAYLHPEWIVEYARMLVLINKTLGTRFFIATHNPDMTSAIRYISEKEGTLDSVNFYIAEESPTSKYQYRYRESREDDDEKSIGPLFSSFIRGIEKIAEYSNPSDKQEDSSDE